MKITLQKIKIKDLVAGYTNNKETGSVTGLSGGLNIRPPYQREFIYKDKQRNAVIHTVLKSFPLNTFYWSKNNDNTYEVLDGQQRTISICDYVSGSYFVPINGNNRGFINLSQEEKNQILNYELFVYICEGTEQQKLDWFQVINIAGEKLTDQELRNAVYTGPFLSDAKNKFSKPNGEAYHLAKEFLKGSPIRQEYLETALKWISNDKIDDYMAAHQFDFNADELWIYFSRVIAWVKTTFPNYRKEMKGIEWGLLYNEYKDAILDPVLLEQRIKTLMMDEDVTNRRGIYVYLLKNEERYLSLRKFSDIDKRRKYEEQNGRCAISGKELDFDDMQGDHIRPWSRGGKTVYENLQMISRYENQVKSDN